MRQLLKHGATIEAATPAEVADIIAATLDTQRSIDYYPIKGTIDLDASGNGQVALERVSPQYDWLMERVAIAGPGAVSALVAIFEGTTNPSDMREVIQMGAAGMYSDSFSNDMWIPGNSMVIVSVTAGVASEQLAYNFQVRLQKRKQPR